MSTAQNAVVDCCSCCSCCCCSCSLSFSALQLAIALMISFTRFPLHCCMSVCVALPLCVCVCSRRKMAALIRVDISGHTTAAPLEIATTPPYTHTHLHTHTEKRGERALCGLCFFFLPPSPGQQPQLTLLASRDLRSSGLSSSSYSS